MEKKKWSDLTDQQKRAIYVGGALESMLTVAAVRDLGSRPADEVSGPKSLWLLAFLVQPFGPLAYFLTGRR